MTSHLSSSLNCSQLRLLTELPWQHFAPLPFSSYMRFHLESIMLVTGPDISSLLAITDLILGCCICLWYRSGSFQSPGTRGSFHTGTGSTSNPHVGHRQIPGTSAQPQQPAQPLHPLQGDLHTRRSVTHTDTHRFISHLLMLP